MPPDQKRHKALVYQRQMQGKFSNNTINLTFSALNSFLEVYDTPINFRGKRVRRKMDIESHNFSNGDLSAMFKIANTKEKAILSLATSLGWEVSGVLNLKRERLEKLIERAKAEGKQYYYFLDQRQKTSVPRLGILNPLSLEWVSKWLKESEDKKPRKRWALHPHAYATSDVFDITQEACNQMLRKLAREAHIKTTGRIRFHKLRAWVMSGLSRGGMNEFEVKFAVGKAIPMSDFTYLQTLQVSIEEKYPSIYESYLNLETPVKAVAELSMNLEQKTQQLENVQFRLAEMEAKLRAATAIRGQSDVLMSQIMQDPRFEKLLMEIVAEQGSYEARENVKDASGKVVDVKIHKFKNLPK